MQVHNSIKVCFDLCTLSYVANTGYLSVKQIKLLNLWLKIDKYDVTDKTELLKWQQWFYMIIIGILGYNDLKGNLRK